MSSLLTICTWTSDEVKSFDTSTGLGSQNGWMTLAQSHDSSDSTRDACAWMSNGVDPDGGYQRHSAIATTVAAGWSIDYVRVYLKAMYSVAQGSGSVTWQPRIDGTNRGSPATVNLSSFAWDYQDFATDPADSNPWTESKINAQTWGYYATTSGQSTSFGDELDLLASEFKIEVWGSLAASPRLMLLGVG